MRRRLPALILAAAVVAAVVLAGSALVTEQDYRRLLAEGDAAMAERRSVAALEAYTGALTLRPDSMVAHLRRGMTYQQRGEFEVALRDLRRAAVLEPTNPRSHELIGDVELALGHPVEAQAAFDRGLALDDRDAMVLYKAALARHRAGDLPGAIDQLRRAVRLEPAMAEAHYLLGLSLRGTGRDREGMQALETARTHGPGLVPVREALAAAYRDLGRTSRMLDELEALAALEPARPERAAAVGRALLRAGRRSAAESVLTRAAERFPDHASVRGALGAVWLAQANAGDGPSALRRAKDTLTAAAALPGAAGEVRTALGEALLASGETREAIGVLRQATQQRPVDPEAYRWLARALARAGDVSGAAMATRAYTTLTGRAPEATAPARTESRDAASASPVPGV